MEGICYKTLMDRLKKGEPLGISGPVLVSHTGISPRDAEEGRAYPLSNREVVLGRRQDADVVVPIPEVSRRHCALGLRSAKSRRVTVTDLGTRNGTNVNGKLIPRNRPIALMEPVVTLRLAERTTLAVMDEKSFQDYLWVLIRSRVRG